MILGESFLWCSISLWYSSPKSPWSLSPLLLKEVVDAIICDDSKKEDLEASYFIKMFKDDDTGCPSVEETYILIGLYAGCMFLADFLNYIREIPYATMSALAEISIAYDVYDHV